MTVLVLFGPTASGKTDLLLRHFGRGDSPKAEIVSADSMQVYRGMDIGTAKPSPEERLQLPHHLIDIRNPDEQFTAGDFVRLAREAIDDIAGRGNIPIVSGGTGFYLRNLVLGLPEAPPSNQAIRDALKLELKEKGAAALMEELARFDPVSAGKIHLNDEYRLLRALEVQRLCGRPLSSFSMSTGDGAPEYDFRIIGLYRPREELYRRINERCAAMFSQGLPEEVQKLYDSGYTPRDPGLRAIGYREFFVEDPLASGVFRLSNDIAGVQALVAMNSRRYAKRQITFFSSLPGAQWINPNEQLVINN
jgi:tRNA dimethylallyltransferase